MTQPYKDLEAYHAIRAAAEPTTVCEHGVALDDECGECLCDHGFPMDDYCPGCDAQSEQEATR